jgi:hypothetical protein
MTPADVRMHEARLGRAHYGWHGYADASGEDGRRPDGALGVINDAPTGMVG